LSKNRFYRRQIASSFLYFAGLCFFGILSVLCFAGVYLFYNIIIHKEDILPISLIFGIFIGFFILLKVKVGGRRKRTFEKFAQLSNAEQERINTELGAKWANMLLGESRVYMHSDWFLEFVEYKDIVWVHLVGGDVSVAVPVGEIAVEIQLEVASLKIYDKNGMCYKARTKNFDTANSLIKIIKEVAPSAIFGYSKERAKLYKKDIERFMFEGKNIK